MVDEAMSSVYTLEIKLATSAKGSGHSNNRKTNFLTYPQQYLSH